MTQELWNSVDSYLKDLLLPSDDALDAALAASAAAKLPLINVSPIQGKLLMFLARIHGAQTILEIGTLGGYSTIWLARGMAPAGHLLTLEINPEHAAIARANLARAALAERVEIRVGPAADALRELVEQRQQFDLIFIDADKANYPAYFEASLRLSRPGTMILADNIIRKGAVTDPASTDPNVLGVRRFFELVAAEPKVNATAIQTVGSKGHDGFAIILVK